MSTYEHLTNCIFLRVCVVLMVPDVCRYFSVSSEFIPTTQTKLVLPRKNANTASPAGHTWIGER